MTTADPILHGLGDLHGGLLSVKPSNIQKSHYYVIVTSMLRMELVLL